MGRIGFGEIVVVLLVALLLFGPKKLPELARAIGNAIQEFKKAMNTPADKSSDDKDKTKDKD
ncbi:MAG: twin-arginine translocase TatA/TatE family subunit [Candidatus Omnitrophica bacterium]|nr:twin-arginine translocase TatA/TatE family subunit [Candidatus Omnitrophota bacterium]